MTVQLIDKIAGPVESAEPVYPSNTFDPFDTVGGAGAVEAGGAAETVEDADVPIIEFVAPMPGFAERRFVLVRIDDAGLLYSLTSVDAPELRFLVAPPAPFFPGYEVDIDDEAVALLGTPAAEDLLVLLMVNTGNAPGEASANLMAPIVVARHSRRAVQLVLGGSGLPVRAPLFPA